MQLVWRADLSWDCSLPPELTNQWNTFIAELPELSSVRISRYFGTRAKSSVLLCGFCDVLECGYAAMVYICFADHNGNIIVSLVVIKTKMAPITSTIMPWLELCTTVLLAKLMSRVESTLNYKLSIERLYV